MKCENCGKNEVTFVYRSNINGQIEEKHLCAECAKKLGYTRALARSRSRMENFFGDSFLNDGFFGSSFLNDFFTPMPSLMGRLLDNPFDDFFAEMPALGAAPAEAEQEQKKQDTLVDGNEQSAISRQREINAMRVEMKKAVEQENFERAAELRDQIRRLESDQG